MKKSIIIGILMGTLMGCAKEEESSIVGKWYYGAKDTKKSTGSGCDLKDTTIIYSKNNTPLIIELTSDGSYIVSYPQNTTVFKGTYTYTNGILKTSVNGLKDSLTVSNLTSEGWRVLQKNYIWCPSKTAFNEYLNYKKF